MECRARQAGEVSVLLGSTIHQGAPILVPGWGAPRGFGSGGVGRMGPGFCPPEGAVTCLACRLGSQKEGVSGEQAGDTGRRKSPHHSLWGSYQDLSLGAD